MSLETRRLTNCNIYLNGSNLLGKAEEVTLPNVKYITSEHKALGLAGKFNLPTGGVEAMEAKIKWNSIYADVMAAAANPYAVHRFMVRGLGADYGAQGKTGDTSVVCFLEASFKNLPLGGYKPHDNVEVETELNVTYVKLVIGGVVVAEFGALDNTWMAGDMDVLAAARDAMGV